jgi:hypothetical protein
MLPGQRAEIAEALEGQLRARLASEGFVEIWLALSSDGRLVDYAMRRGRAHGCDTTEDALATLTKILNEEGYRVGISELGIVYNGNILNGVFYTRPMDEHYQEDVESGEA